MVAVVDLEQNTAYALSAQQTEAGLSERAKAAAMEKPVCRNRVDFYLGHLAHCQTYVPKRVEYVVADSFYSKRKWVDGVVKLGWNSIGKLRQDANLNYLYQGPRRPGPGRQKTYDGKVSPLDRNGEYSHYLIRWCPTLDCRGLVGVSGTPNSLSLLGPPRPGERALYSVVLHRCPSECP